MADVLFIAVLAAFFGICVLFVKACDRMIERGDAGGAVEGAGEPDPTDVPETLEAAA
jgi:hypothetical protein